jgi:ubiquinone/menaquinone biosynthesis C-methylase UbiE
MGEVYHNYRNNEKFKGELEKFKQLLPEGGHILDAGCGVGRPTAEFLANNGFEVTGVDISERMVELAAKNVPKASFLQKNIVDLDFPDASFDGAICVYTLWHVPRKNHEKIIANFHRMLRDNGILVINTGTHESEGMSTFFGQPMLWSTNDPGKTLRHVKDAGFEILFEGKLVLGGEVQYWIFAKKRTPTTPLE